MFIALLVFIFATTSVSAADPPDPDWFYVYFHQEDWFANNKTDLRYNYANRYIGQLQFGPDQYYYNLSGTGWPEDFTLVVSTPFDGFHLTNVDDETLTFSAYLDITKDGNLVRRVQSAEEIIPYTVPWAQRPLFQFTITIFPRFDDQETYKGTYFLPLNMELYVNYGDDDEAKIGESLFNILVYFVEKSSSTPGGGGQGSVFTNLWIQRYSTADGVDIPTLQQSQGSLPVGSVNFSSNDKKNSSSYLIRISPGEDPNSIFAFHKQGNATTAIPYKVYVPGRSQLGSQDGSFDIPVTTRSPAGYWQDYFELGITQMNYLNWSYTVGNYTSLIQIELLKE
jgi:hypothetical protein